MTARRTGGFALERALDDRGFTPRVRDVPALLDLLAPTSEHAEAAERALARVGAPAARAAMERAGAAPPAIRRRLVRLVGAIAAGAPDPSLRAFLIERLGDEDPAVRAAAASALRKLEPADDVAQALAAALERETQRAPRKAMVEALGKLGGEGALGALATVIDRGAADEVLGRAVSRAVIMVTRTTGRDAPSTFAADVPAQAPVAVVLRCRAGLERFLHAELESIAAAGTLRAPAIARDRFGSSGRVLAELRGAPEVLVRARTALAFGFPLPAVEARGDLGGAVVEAMTSDAAVAVLRRWTVGPIRYRIAWSAGGKRRAVVWDAAERIARHRPELVNDPTASTWEAQVFEAGDAILVELVPRFADPRFAYRRGDVPAASHPTIAAALVRAAGPAPADVVWDPFVGSGTELCERAIAGPYRALYGTDRDPAALEIARQNLEAAGASGVVLARGDATRWTPPEPPTAIVTNPPLGRRVARGADLGPLLDRFVEHAARVLAPGGRLVWMSPFARRTVEVAAAAGLTAELRQDVDMGGFTAQLQVLTKRASKPQPKGEAPARIRR